MPLRSCHRQITTLRVSLVAGTLLLSGCIASTDVGSAGVSVTGTWRYAGRQTVPADADLAGTLSFTTQVGATVAGALDVTETDFRGTPRRLTGAVAGRTVDSTTVDFDLVLSAVTRRHVGRVVGDSLTGTWIEQAVAGGAPTASGSFRAARNR